MSQVSPEFVTINQQLLDDVFEHCAVSYEEKTAVESYHLVVSRESILLRGNQMEAENNRSTIAVKVDVAVDDVGDLGILPPAEFTKSQQQRNAKRQKTKRIANHRKKLSDSAIAVVAESSFEPDLAEDAMLCTSLSRASMPLANVQGPYLLKQPDGTLILNFSIFLVPNQVVVSRNQQNLALRFLARALQDPSLVSPLEYQGHPVDLLRVITRKPSDVSLVPDISVEGLRTSLLPYQRETIRWCLRREGKDYADGIGVHNLDPTIRDVIVNPPLGWRQVGDSDIWVNPYLLKSSAGEPQISQSPSRHKGKGILAEEMGLGKTLEMITLVLLNPRPKADAANGTYISNNEQIVNGHRSIRPSKATLVIVPRTILHQWVSEVKLHSPSLRTYIVESPNPPLDELMSSDLVFVTYTQLSRWLPHTAVKRKRTSRSTRTRFAEEDDLGSHSTLVEVQFWRVILDEVQMVHTSTSAAAQVAKRIPRVHAWAASGTPVKHSLEDLRGITYFLDLFPFVERPCWQRLISSPIDFARTMEVVSIRHTRSSVDDQFHIPKQRRRLILLKFSAVERARYNRLYEEFMDDAKNANSNLTLWLLRLRQACSHHVASAANYNSGNMTGNGEVVALTLDQVLAQLVETADLELWVEQREKFLLQLQLGQLYDISYQMPKALKEWEDVVQQLKEHLDTESGHMDALIDECKSRQNTVDDLEVKLDSVQEYDRGSENDEGDDASDDDEGEEKGAVSARDAAKNQRRLEESAVLDARRALSISNNRLKSLRLRCRSLRELLHRSYFFLGTGYFRSSKRLRLQLPEDEYNSTEVQETVKVNFANETKYYELAEKTRSIILNEAADKVTELSGNLKTIKFMNCFRLCPIAKSKIADELSELATDLFTRLLSILKQPLLEDNTHGEYPAKLESADGADVTEAYTKTLDNQEFAFVYLEVLQLLLRDRAAAISGGNIQLKFSLESGDPEPVKEILDRRESIVERLYYDRQPLTTLFKSIGVANADISKLKSEIRTAQNHYSALRDLYNSRVEYYKQLQDLSDQVTDIDVGNRTDYENLITNKIREIALVEQRMREKLKNQTYLRNLESEKHDDDERHNDLPNVSDEHWVPDSNSKCSICLEVIVDGALTPCGHFFCEDCLYNWLSTRARCPLCSRRVAISEAHRFRSGELASVPEPDAASNGVQAENPKLKEIAKNDDNDDIHASDLFVPISTKTYNKIRRMGLARMYGVKLDMIVKHAMHIRSLDPSAQIVVFSQWGTMLKVLKSAFCENGVTVASTYDSIADVNSFRTDPNVACLLLHAKADVAGLTLVNANHVFLCEPLMNTAIESQAVSRISRIGQTRPTTVWQFCVEDTVEQTILGITTKQRLLQLSIDGHTDPDESLAFTVSNKKDLRVDRKSGAEIVGDRDQLQRILFRQGTSA